MCFDVQGRRPNRTAASPDWGGERRPAASVSMSSIRLQGIEKRWGDTAGVSRLDMVAEEGRFLVLLGPSGCGKSTTLRIIAGLESPTSGSVFIADQDVTDAPPAKRKLSMVFQSYALFPHLSTAENIVFGLKVRRVPAPERERRLHQVAELVGLEQLLDRKTAQLSGGQRQRVALARAIIAENRICLMDEPLSNLDAKLRHDMRVEIRSLQQRLGMTVVYVTHDQTEAMSMADTIVLMRDGAIEQQGTPDDLYNTPATTFAARFIGTPPMNLLNLTGTPSGGVLDGCDQVFTKPGAEALVLGVRPEDISITADGGVPASLVSADYLGADTTVAGRVGTQEIKVRCAGRFRIDGTEQVGLSWPGSAIRLFNRQSGRAVAKADLLSPAGGHRGDP